MNKIIALFVAVSVFSITSGLNAETNDIVKMSDCKAMCTKNQIACMNGQVSESDKSAKDYSERNRLQACDDQGKACSDECLN